MALSKFKIGTIIEVLSQKCNIPNLSVDDVSGINSDKEFFEPAKAVGNDTSNYKIVPPNYFACNLMHVGRDVVLPIALNCTNNDKIVSPAYTVFKLIDEQTVLKEYFFMMLNSKEMDRFFWFNTDSSVREGLPWETFCNIELQVPSLEIQQKYVNVYKAMVANQKVYEKGLDDLKLVCDAIFSNYNTENCQQIKNIIVVSNKKNYDNTCNRNNLRGINEFGEFTSTRDTITDEKLCDYLIVPSGSFAVNFMCLGNFGKFYLGLNDSNMNYIVSPACQSFTVDDSVNPNYLRFVLTRSEFQRRCVFCGAGNTRGGINITDFGELFIPIPSKYVQNAIANIYLAYDVRRKISNKLKMQIKNICPILIQGALQEGKKEES